MNLFVKVTEITWTLNHLDLKSLCLDQKLIRFEIPSSDLLSIGLDSQLWTIFGPVYQERSASVANFPLLYFFGSTQTKSTKNHQLDSLFQEKEAMSTQHYSTFKFFFCRQKYETFLLTKILSCTFVCFYLMIYRLPSFKSSFSPKILPFVHSFQGNGTLKYRVVQS